MTCPFAFPAEPRRPLLSDVLDCGASFPPIIASGCITAPPMKPKPSPDAMRRRVWLCEIIPTLPPRSHQRIRFEGELQGIIRATLTFNTKESNK